MADIEHRIVLQYIIYDNKEGDFKIEKHASHKPQEAIERIAKALIQADYPHAQKAVWDMRWDNPASKDYYLIMANAALNALLGE